MDLLNIIEYQYFKKRPQDFNEIRKLTTEEYENIFLQIRDDKLKDILDNIYNCRNVLSVDNIYDPEIINKLKFLGYDIVFLKEIDQYLYDKVVYINKTTDLQKLAETLANTINDFDNVILPIHNELFTIMVMKHIRTNILYQKIRTEIFREDDTQKIIFHHLGFIKI